jgi:hypothetical protein
MQWQFPGNWKYESFEARSVVNDGGARSRKVKVANIVDFLQLHNATEIYLSIVHQPIIRDQKSTHVTIQKIPSNAKQNLRPVANCAAHSDPLCPQRLAMQKDKIRKTITRHSRDIHQ